MRPLDPPLDYTKTKYPLFNQLDSLEKIKITLNPSDKEILPSVFNFIKRSLEARI